MSSEMLEKYKFDDLILKRNQGVNTTTEKVKYAGNGIPVIRAQNITPSGIKFNDIAYVTDATFARIRDDCKPKRDDVLYTNIGSQFGTACVVNVDFPFMIAWNVLRIQVDNSKTDAYYLKYFLNNPEMKVLVRGMNSSSTMPFVSGKEIGNIEVYIPPLHIQRRIAGILSALDDKIEFNLQTNTTLETIAQTIFKEWFVDFNVPGATGEMVESELGMIPRGWRVGKLGEIVEVKGGTTPSTKEERFWNGKNYWATPKDLSNLRSPILLTTERKITVEGVKQISSGILPAGTLLLSSRAPIGYLAISDIPVSINQGFIAINATATSNLFILHWLKENMETIISRANGSTFLEISKTNFREIELVIPEVQIVQMFDKVIAPIYEQIKVNEQESITLTTLRDGLLPKLMNGEINV